MAFKDVKQNYSVYILNKQDITITDGNAKGNSNTAQ